MYKVCVIGLDGATFDLIEPWIQEGFLPNLKYLITTGTSGRFRSTIPSVTPCAWTSFMTGKKPGNTGIFGFFRRAEDDYRVKIIDSSARNAPAIWEILNVLGKRTGIINVPTTFPAMPIDGFCVACGLTTPDTDSKGFTFPEDLFEKHGLSRKDYILRPEGELLYNKKRADKLFRRILEMEESREHLALRLLQEEPWDFAMVHFSATDRIEHTFWKYFDPASPIYEENSRFKNAMLEVHKRADDTIGKILESLPRDTLVIVMSDHGHGRNEYNININDWLRKLGLLSFRDVSLGDYAGFISEKMRMAKSRGTQYSDKYYELIEKLGELSRRLTFLDKVFPPLIERIPWLKQKLTPHHMSLIDWERTKAYSMGGYGEIYINVEGREPRGIVSKRDYKHIANYIKGELLNLTNERSQRIIDYVYTKDEIYQGTYYEQAPDIVPFTEQTVCYFNPTPFNGKIVSKPMFWQSGNHKLYGIFIINGQGIKHNHHIEGACIEDMAPTILYAMGLPIIRDIDGKVLTDCFESEHLARSPITSVGMEEIVRGEKTATDESERIRRVLEGLGYLS